MRNRHVTPVAKSATTARDSAAAEPRIWAIGGGKGGIGKSVVTSSLALALARRGERCALVDADLGGANLHTLLGVRKPALSLSHFLDREVPNLADVVCQTPVPNLWLLSGAAAFVQSTNPRHSQKEKLLRHIRRLDFQHVFLDLSAGSAFNVLDFFLAAERRILVVTPELTAIENAYQFLKAAFFRSLRSAARFSPARSLIHRSLRCSSTGRVQSARELIAAVSLIDPDAGSALRERARRFSTMLVVNQAQDADHRYLGEEIRTACREHLDIEIDYLGALERDDSVRQAVGRRKPVLDLFPDAAFSRDLNAVVDRLRGARRPSPEGERWVPPRRFAYEDPPPATYGLLADEGEHSAPWPFRRAPGRPAEPEPRAAADRRSAAAGRLPRMDVSRPGTFLRCYRECLGLTLPELVRRTRVRNLESIEAERFDRLPPVPYVRGFVLQYARALGIANPEAVASTYAARYELALARG